VTDQATFLNARYDEAEANIDRSIASVRAGEEEAAGWTWVHHDRADLAGKRRIVAEMTGRYLESWTAAQTVLNALCLPFADHPDYDPAWAL
jgi:hypothetical protein